MYILVKDNIVRKLVLDEDFPNEDVTQYDEAIKVDGAVGVGWGYRDGVLIKPFIQPVAHRRITVGAFFDRFGEQKYPILASTNALVRALILDTSVRKFIDLNNPQTLSGLDMIKDAGFPIVPMDIISAQVHPDELA